MITVELVVDGVAPFQGREHSDVAWRREALGRADGRAAHLLENLVGGVARVEVELGCVLDVAVVTLTLLGQDLT